MSLKALIVDDEQAIREMLVKFLQKKGFNIETASSGNQALNILSANPVDIIITDCRMPDGSGIDLIKGLSNTQNATTPLIMVSGYADQPANEILKLGAFAYLDKPVKRKILFEIIKDALKIS